ncbi:MAG: hypothetical protein ABIY71_05200 [Flavobacteriales bacterium]
MIAVADKHIIDLLRQRDGLVTLVKMKSGVTYKVFNIAWGYDMNDTHAHVTTNISPRIPASSMDFFLTQDIEQIMD